MSSNLLIHNIAVIEENVSLRTKHSLKQQISRPEGNYIIPAM